MLRVANQSPILAILALLTVIAFTPGTASAAILDYDAGLETLSSNLSAGMQAKLSEGSRVAVTYILNSNGERTYLSDEIAFELESYISKLNGITICNRSQLDKALEEFQFQQSDYIDQDRVTKLGEWLGANYVLIGDYSDWGDSVKVKIKCMDLEKGVVIYADSVRIAKATIPARLLEAQAPTTRPADPGTTATRNGKTVSFVEDVYEENAFFEDQMIIKIQFEDGSQEELVRKQGNFIGSFKSVRQATSDNKRFFAFALADGRQWGWASSSSSLYIFDVENDSALTITPYYTRIDELTGLIWIDNNTLEISTTDEVRLVRFNPNKSIHSEKITPRR